MGFQHRKLMADSINETSTNDCSICYQFCVTSCFEICPALCPPYVPPDVDIYPPPSPFSDSGSHSNKPNKFLIITSTILAAAFLVLCCFAYYVWCYRRRSNGRSRSSEVETDETRDEFLDENHGPIVDHPIWYINTVGLQPSIIRSIAVCKYKRGDGLVEGTDCAVCLTEFEEDETLRLLPKCNHAFHVPCIDTWLRSHTTCPMCRAPIVSNPGNRGPSSSGVNNENPGRTEETQVVIVEEDNNEGPDDGGTSEIREEEERDELAVESERNNGDSSGTEDGIQAMRRSVSLNSMAASQISKDPINGSNPEGSSNGNSDNERGKEKEPSVRIVPRRVAGNQSLLRFMCQSSIGRSLQNKPGFMRRSFSYSGKFSLPIINNKTHNTNPPLRSF